MSDTIWSSTSKVSMGNDSNSQYRSMIDLIEPEVAKMLSYNDPIGVNSDLVSSRLSLNDGSDIDNRFGFRTGALSAITAPVGYNSNTTSPNQNKRLGLGTASISGGIANRHPPQESFLQKFSGVGEATRDMELASNLGKLDLEGSSRRTSFNQQQPPLDLKFDGNYSSPTGSLNESLNMPAARTSRHQSISDKIDQYNNTSPIQAGAQLVERDEKTQANIWNPAAAATFNPSAISFYPQGGFAQTMGPFNPPAVFVAPTASAAPPSQQGQNGQTPPSWIPSPPMAFMDPRMYNVMYPMTQDASNGSANSSNDGEKYDEKPSPSQARKDYVHTPGIGMPRQTNAGFVFQPMGYPVYQQGQPAANSQLEQEPKEEKPASTTPPTNGLRKKNGAKPKPAPHIYRSPLLEEVRSNSKGKEYFLKDIYGHAVEFTKDQHGSRFIQQKLPHASEEEKEVIFNEIRSISYELMTDVFGNYVIQKYFEHGTTTQKNVLLESMLGHIYELSLQMYGCRVVQRALEAIDLDGQIKIISELKSHVLVCAKDQNGNHVIQKSIERIEFSHVRFILESLENQIYHLSTHPYGCRVVQRLLEHSNEQDQQKILLELNRFIFYLIQDQYGNYVMQHILERGHPEDRQAILKVVLGSVVNFSKHKFASNVIEKCIKFGSVDQRKQILHEVLLGNEDLKQEDVEDDSPLALMMKDQYANYVIQKLVEGFDTESEEKRLLVLKLRQYLKQISSKNSYGKHLASVEKMIIVAETALIEADNN